MAKREKGHADNHMSVPFFHALTFLETKQMTKDYLQSVYASESYDYYLSGPPIFMHSLSDVLREAHATNQGTTSDVKDSENKES